MKTATKFNQNKWAPSQESNPGTPEQDAGELSTQPKPFMKRRCSGRSLAIIKGKVVLCFN